MKKWIAKIMLAAVFMTMLGAGARVMAEDFGHNPGVKHNIRKKFDPNNCGCLYHTLENFVVGLFK